MSENSVYFQILKKIKRFLQSLLYTSLVDERNYYIHLSPLIPFGAFDLRSPQIFSTAPINGQPYETTTPCSTYAQQKMNYAFPLLSTQLIIFVNFMYLITWVFWIVFIYFTCLLHYYVHARSFGDTFQFGTESWLILGLFGEVLWPFVH